MTKEETIKDGIDVSGIANQLEYFPEMKRIIGELK